MPRSHKPRKRYIPKRVDLDNIGLAQARVSLLLPRQRLDLVVPMRRAFDRLRAGQGGWGDWCCLADATNVAERLAALGIASDRMPEFQAAQAVLADLHARQQERGSWVMRGPEIATLEAALELHDVQLELCTQGELAEAITTVQRCVAAALAGNASPTAHICLGALGSSTTTPPATAITHPTV